MKVKSTTTASRFIVFEGPDGSGKTTAVKTFRDLLIHYGVPPEDIVLTKEPYRLEHDPSLSLEDFLEDRKAHLEEVILSKAGKWLLCDRYADSTIVYQRLLRGELLDDHEVLESYREYSLGIRPAWTVYMTTTWKTCAERLLARGESVDEYDVQEAHKAYREVALGRAYDRVLYTDGSLECLDNLVCNLLGTPPSGFAIAR
jgi:dTMP kinase